MEITMSNRLHHQMVDDERTVAMAVADATGLRLSDVLDMTVDQVDDLCWEHAILTLEDMEDVPDADDPWWDGPAEWSDDVDAGQMTLSEFINEPRDEPTYREAMEAMYEATRRSQEPWWD